MTNFEKYGDRSVPEYYKRITLEQVSIRFHLDQYHKWLTSTAAPTLTPEERKIAEALQVLGFEWLARDKNQRLFAYREKPHKRTNNWLCEGDILAKSAYVPEQNTGLFPFIQWTDTEPTKISDLLEVK